VLTQLILAAWNLLSEPESRLAYDAFLREEVSNANLATSFAPNSPSSNPVVRINATLLSANEKATLLNMFAHMQTAAELVLHCTEEYLRLHPKHRLFSKTQTYRPEAINLNGCAKTYLTSLKDSACDFRTLNESFFALLRAYIDNLQLIKAKVLADQHCEKVEKLYNDLALPFGPINSIVQCICDPLAVSGYHVACDINTGHQLFHKLYTEVLACKVNAMLIHDGIKSGVFKRYH